MAHRKPLKKERPFLHFSLRVAERISPDICARTLANQIIADIGRGGHRMRFAGRMVQKSRRLWLLDIEDTEYGIIFDHELNEPITVLTDFLVVRNLARGCILCRPIRRAKT